jgi:hypothetical protein
MVEQITNEAWLFLVWSTFYSALGGILIGVSHDIKGKKLPTFEVENKSNKQEGMVQTKKNLQERGAYLGACTILSGVIGFMIGLYYLGFLSEENIPNIYQRIFIGISAGFLMPKILEYTESLSLSKLVKRILENENKEKQY